MEKYTLIITEKPDAARRIASALDIKGQAKRRDDDGVPYYVAYRDKEIVVVPALGHLYTIAQEGGRRSDFPVFSFKWVPRNVAERKAQQVRAWVETISRLARDADVFIDACDYDIEGSLIGYCILRYACDGKQDAAKRMKYSTLTRDELEKSYAQLLPHLDFTLAEAGRTRHEIDWLYGINLSRALTLAAKECSGRYAALSTGRVQGPTLKFMAARERAIKGFVPTPYWTVEAEFETNEQTFIGQYETDVIETKHEAATIVSECQGKSGQIGKIEVKQAERMPPEPFDLGGLQAEAYRLFRYDPRRTSAIAQRLYLNALISYPRTGSQILPPTIGYRTILRNLGRASEYRRFAKELLAIRTLKPREGKKEDPAHPAIYPTGDAPARVLDSSERKVLDLIVRRFMATFSRPAIIQSKKIQINVGRHCFHLNGRQTTEEGWLQIYEPYARSDETVLPAVREKQNVKVNRIRKKDEFTKPPARHNPSSVLRKMERMGIGTKATRADMIQTLYDRKYVVNEKMTVTSLGFEVLEILEENCPIVVSVGFTKELEEKMNRIQANSERRDRVLADAVAALKPIAEELKKKQREIGERLSKAISESRVDERTIGTCPICKTGKLVVVYSRKSGKRFAGCTNYFERRCRASFPLPQRGAVRSLGRSCRGCGWPILQVRMRGRRAWTLCLNPHCVLSSRREEGS